MAEGAISVKDVAELAGVSLGTVSNVLNNPDRVGAATRERVLQAIDRLGYVRNEAARQLRAGRSRTIGLIVLDVANPFFTDIAAGVELAAWKAGLSLVLCNSAEDSDRQDHYLRMLQELRAFGVLISPVATQNSTIQQLRLSGTPVVLVDRVSGQSQCSVSVDDRAGGELAIGHLLSQGYQRLAYVAGQPSIQQVADRLDGARAALRAVGRDPDDLQVFTGSALTVANGRRAGEQIAALPAGKRPEAVFCANDLLALGLLQEMTRRGLDVPGDLAIVGYDDIDFAAAAAVPLTSIRQPSAQLGQAAAELLIEEATEPDSHRHRQVVFEPELVVRSSTTRPSDDVPAVERPGVSRRGTNPR